MLPFNKKATAINIIILVSKTITIGAPFVNELEEPIPIVVIIVLALLSLLIVSFFKSKDELDQMQKVDANIAAMMSASKNGDAINPKLLAAEKLEGAMEDIAAEGDTDKEDE